MLPLFALATAQLPRSSHLSRTSLRHPSKLHAKPTLRRKPRTTMSNNVDSDAFYGEYHGHRVEDLATLHASLGDRPRVWLAGDSSLDSKFYQPPRAATALNGYEQLLHPPLSRRDVCYWLNKHLGPRYATINCAIEESTLSMRNKTHNLPPQDAFVRDHLQPNDILVISVGGNDVALRPSAATALAAAKAVLLNSATMLEETPNTAWGMPHFKHLFHDETHAYISRLIERNRPRLIVPCMIYFPDERTDAPSWATSSLSLLQYNKRPERLQAIIRAAYTCATSAIKVDGTTVAPCPLYAALDGKDTAQYVARVEPSEAGADAIARLIARTIDTVSDTAGTTGAKNMTPDG